MSEFGIEFLKSQRSVVARRFQTKTIVDQRVFSRTVTVIHRPNYAVGRERLENALKQIENDREIAVENFKSQEKLIEAERIGQRVAYDMEMMREVGYCSGIENTLVILMVACLAKRLTLLLTISQKAF